MSSTDLWGDHCPHCGEGEAAIRKEVYRNGGVAVRLTCTACGFQETRDLPGRVRKEGFHEQR